ncbi:filamentous hemagglutinin N-terminal domain-containing protein [Selenomonas ruminantium]|nr:filamentous hemagglutinin N-terminal domain-containing protein [Selenomonas ruminantium]
MRRDKDIRQIALQVSIALSASVFSIMPTVSAATPELDGKPAAAITVDQTTSPQVTDISSTVENNVINWKNFSVPQGETVRFDGGAHTNNYLNVVTGENVSQIDGSIQGGKNVYIVNPNGVVFGESASVDVGALYVSTRNIDDTVKANFADGKGIDLKPLKDTSALPSNDIVNMGTVQANTVFLEGGNIVIGEVNKIKTADGLAVNNNVTIQTKGNVTLGRSVSSIVAEKNANDISEAKLAKKATDIDASLADSGSKNSAGYTFTLNNTATVLPLIYSEADLMAVSSDCVGKAKSYTYTLKADLDFTGKSFSPISNFSSTFDGEFHTISGIKVTGGTYGGLFGAVSNAVIKNVGVVGANITADNAGGIAGHASNTSFTNVFNESSKIKGTKTSNYSGGIVGYATNCSINTAYNTGTVEGTRYSGGIAGYVNVTTIEHVYNTGTVENGIVGASTSTTGSTVADGYTSGSKVVSSYYKGSGADKILKVPTSHYVADYTSSNLSSISNKGGENTTWRIYEGQSLPLLRAFLTGHGTVNVNYHYDQGTNSGDLAGSDLSTTYNGSDVVLSGINYTKGGGAFTPTAKIITAPTDNTIDGDITSTNYDTVNKKVRTLAAFYTGQQGYDLVGNNYTINQKSVTIDSSTVSTAPYSREYNGTNDAADAIKNFSYGGANGIVDGDIAAGKVSIDTSGVNAYFVGTGGKITDADAPDVGLGDKTIALTGGVTIQNAAGYHNYILTGSASFGDASNPTTFGGNSITPKKITVNLKNPTGIKKPYDGKTDVKGDDYLPGAQFVSQAVNYTVSGAQKTETVNFNTNGITANYVDADDNPVATAGTYDKKVKYSGIAIASVDNGKVTNYELVDAQGNTIYFKDKNEVVSGTGSLYGSGKISRIKLDNTGFSWYKGTDAQPATREYDKTSAYTKPVGSGDTAYTVDSAQTAAIQDDLTFTVTGANFLKTINATDLAVNAGEAHYVGYTVAVSGDAAVNYTFGDNDEPIGSSITLFGDGSITPRTIKLDVASGRSADKMYDAGTAVLDNADKSSFTISEDSTVNSGFHDGTDTYHLLEYTGGDDYKLLDDGAKIVYSGVYKQKGTEGDANVYFVNDQVASKNITYTANIENANGNYVFDNGTTSKTFDNGVGKITQREISNLYFSDVNKTYDTTAVVDHDDIAVDVGDGVGQVKLYGSDTAATVFDMSKVTGVYVHKDANKKDEDVEDGGKAKSKNVTYTLQDDFLTNHNYKLSDSIGTTVNGEGAILPITLNDRSKLTLDVSGVTKVYDGDTNIKGPHASSTDNDNMAFIGTKGLVYALDDNPDHDIKLNIDSVHAAYYDWADSNNATPQGITYELAVSGDSSGNYTIANTLLTGDYLKWASTVDGWTPTEKAKMTGVITKRDLIVTPLHDPVTKVYDGGTAVKDGTTTLENDTAVSFDGWINVDGRTKTATANYTDKNVDSEDETEAGGKTVNYVIKLDSATTYGNYNIKDAQGHMLPGNMLTGYTLTGKGHITPATLHIEFAQKHKTYDGNDSYTGTVSPTYTGRITGDDVELDDTAYAAKFNSPNVADAHTITYTIVLKGDDRGNYIIDPTNSTTVGNVTTIDDDGYIEALGINSATVDYNSINKVYDATNSVTYDHTGDNRYFDGEKNKADAKDYINSITLGTNVVLVHGTDYTIKSAFYDKTGKDASKATYEFKFSDDVAANYNLSGLTGYSVTDKVYTWTATENVSITPKKLQASLNDTVLHLERVYNGETNLPVTTAEAASKVTVTGFVNDNEDTTAFDDSLVNGRYVDRNVAYDADGNITTKDVLFDVKLKGTGKENYVINDTNANSATLTGENLGKITPKELAVDFDYTEKTYNNNPDAAVRGVRLTGLQTGDKTRNLDTAAIEAQFGSKNGDTFTANGDVNYDESAEGKAGYKGVQYSNLQNAMLTGFGKDATGYKIAKNYTIADTVYFNEAAQKGKIKRLALTQEYIKYKWDTVTKEYDGTDAAPTGKLHIYTDVLGTSDDKLVDLNYVLKDTNGAVYDNQQVNVVSGHGVTYTLNGLEAKEFHNFEMTQVLMDSFNGKTYTTTGNITPRVLSINIKNPDNWVKVYDGETSVKDASGVVQNQFEYDFVEGQDILQQDSNSVNLIVTGAYGDATANIEPESTATTGKTIKYTLTLDGNTAGNYTLDPDGAAVKNVDETTYTGTGAIKKRTVYVAFDDDYDSTEINRAYKGANDTSAPVDKTRINLVTTIDGDTGLLDADAAVELKKEDIEANYESANVARNTQTKEVEKQNVYVTNFNLQGMGSGNYAVRVNDANNPKTLVGQGTINPIAVRVALKNAPEKTYDKTKAIKDTYLANANFTFTPTPITSENVANDIDITGAYKDANAGTAKEYSYTLTLNNDNYELVTDDDNGHTVTASNYGMKAVLTGADGTITPRKVSVNSIADMTKVYDGTLDGTTNAAANISLNNAVNGMDTGLISGDDAELSATAVYTDNPHAGVSADSDELQEHVVKYTLSLKNTNYELTDDSKEVTGKGYITRRTLSIVADSVSVDVGGTMPEFNGKVTGFVKDEQDNYTDFINGVSFKAADGTTTSTPGSYGVYGWYMGNKKGLLGLDYTFAQAPANDTAFTVNYVNNNTGNPDTKITPNNSIYHQISKDMNSGFGDNGAAAIEYKDKSGKVLGTEKIDSGEINGKGLMIGGGTDMSKQADSNANIGIAGGDIVNMEGANAAGSVNVETTGDGTVVNLEVFSIGGDKQSGDNNSAAEITNTADKTYSLDLDNSTEGEIAIKNTNDTTGTLSSIAITDGKQNILGEEAEDKKEEQEKEGTIAIKSSNGEDDDEIELTVEKQGVNVA